MVIISIIQQLRFSRKDIRKILMDHENEDDTAENAEPQMMQPTKQQFFNILKYHGVAISAEQKQLLLSYIDPKDILKKDSKMNLDKLVELCEKNMTMSVIKSTKLNQFTIMNLVMDVVSKYLGEELPHLVE